MRSNKFIPALIKSGLATSVLLLASGAAFGQIATVTATPIGTGTVDVGATATTATLTLTADATTVIDAGSVVVNGIAAPFSVDGGCASGVTVAGGSCTMNVTFSPIATGTLTDSVTVSATSTTNAITSSLTVTPSPVTLSGTGYVPTVTPTSPVVFNDLGPGVPSKQTVTVSNVADTPLNFTSALTGSTSYSLAGGTCAASSFVLGGATNPTSCTIVVAYASPTGTPPPVDPSQTAALTVTSAFGGATPTQLAQLSLVEQNPTGGVVAAGGGTTVEVELNAVPTSVALNDGSTVPMWGYQCSANSLACTPLNPAVSKPRSASQIKPWSPIVITAMAGQTLAIDLTNSLSFAAGTVTNTVPTSLVIVGQLGGGLGGTPVTTKSPAHAPLGNTWFAQGDTSGATFNPPAQPNRVQSFSTEVLVVAPTAPAAGQCATNPCRLTWNNLRPGTYLIESGTHPSIQGPMGLYGVLVVTAAPTAGTVGTAYPNVSYDADLAMLLSEIDPVQNAAVAAAVSTVGFSETAAVVMRDKVSSVGFALDPSGNPLPGSGGTKYAVGDIVNISGGSGTGATAHVLQVDAITGAIVAVMVDNAGAGYSSIPTSVTVTSPGGGSGANLVAALTLAGTTCSGSAGGCYPPAVNYDPRYYLINGVSFDRTNLAASTFGVVGSAAPVPAIAGNVLLRFVNAGLRMHVPSVVNSTMTLFAEDGNVLPGVPKKQNEVFLAAGKTYDIGIQPAVTAGAATGTFVYAPGTVAVYDRQLSLSTNNQRDGGMQAYASISGGAAPAAGVRLSASDKTFYCIAGTPLAVADPLKGLLGGATGANGVTLGTISSSGVVGPAAFTGAVNATNLSIQSDGTLNYSPPVAVPAVTCSGTFTYVVNGKDSHTATITQCDATSNVTGCGLSSGVTANADSYTSTVGPTAALGARMHIAPPGVLVNDSDALKLPLTVDTTQVLSTSASLSVIANADGSFTASLAPGASAGTYTFTYKAKNTQGMASTATPVMLTFPTASNLAVKLIDAISGTPITSQDYRWIIEEDQTFYVDPACQINSTDPALRPSTCPPLPVESQGYSFHTANMPVVANGCVGAVSCESGQTLLGAPAVCDGGNGQCRTDGTMKDSVDPSQVPLDPKKRYYLTVSPADGVNPTLNGGGGSPDGIRVFETQGGTNNLGDCTSFVASIDPASVGNCGHAMGGAQISGRVVAANGTTPTQVNIKLQRTPLPTAQITVFVFEDDYPLNGENDPSGPPGSSGPAPNEAGLDGFNIVLFDQAGGLGDNTGQPTYDMFNQPLSNYLAGTRDPLTGFDACPLTKRGDKLIGMIPVCPKYEDGVDALGQPILSPLVGQAIIKNLYPGLYEVQAMPAADRITRGEEWLQTNTLDGGKPHEAFIKPNEPGYFQEFGPGGFHVSIGFANPKIINDRLPVICGQAGSNCSANLFGQVTATHMSRTPDQRTFSSGDYSAYGFTQCYVGIGPADDADIAFAKCDDQGKFEFHGIPPGDYKLTVFDQWNDIMLDGLVNQVCVGTHNYTSNGQNGGTPAACAADASGTIIGSTAAAPLVFPVTQWRTNLYTRTFLDTNRDGVSNLDANGTPTEPGLPLVSTNVRYRDGSFGFFNNTDLNGFAGWNEIFPFMNWLVAETTSTRYKQTGTHTVYDAGGPVDGSADSTWTGSNIASGLANSQERTSLPQALRVPGAVYCTSADCTGQSIATGPYGTGAAGSGPLTGLSSARIDPPQPWGTTMGFQGLLGQSVFMEFGMRPMVPGETGGIQGHVIYASTRPFDDPNLLLQLSWEPGVPRVKINLYQEGSATDGEQTLTLVDTTTTTSFDDWAQGFRHNADGSLVSTSYTYTDASGTSKTVTGNVTNMNCPGQDPTSPFFQTLRGSTQWLDASSPKTTVAADSLFKCYDGWSQLNQVQPAPYDGKYTFPSIVNVDPTTGKPAGTGTGVNPGGGSRPGTNCTICTPDPVDGTPMLPAGKYVVEVVVPQGFELVKEEDKNILLGDIYVAPVTVQFPGVGGSIFIMPDQAAVGAAFNPNNPLNQTTNLGSTNAQRHEGDTGSIEAYWPCVGAKRVVPDYNSLFPGAGQTAPFAGATRALCDRKEVTLEDQATALAKFYVFTPAHIAGHFTGTMTNDFASEFDPFSPQFGEKFGPPNLPVGMRDFAGNEMGRVYADQWGIYNGLYFSSWEVNPPNPTGYAPQMSIACMNDPGPTPRRNAVGQYLDASGAVVATPELAQQVTDPSYNPAYSNFCYETPFMPGFTAYMDTPVIPTQAFADGYNLPDSEYPDGTPAIDSVVGNSGVAGPWVSAAGKTLTITCLGHNNADPCSKVVQNPDFSGPGATAPPYNQKTITRHYGFGGTAGTVELVGSDGVPHALNIVTWGNTSITGTVPAGVPNCALQQILTQATPTKPAVRDTQQCAELVITTAARKRSVDAVTVTVGGKVPQVVTPASVSANTFGSVLPNPLQTAIDNATPGDLIIVGPGSYKEHLIMWKPVRLQGVGAASVTVNADAHPAGSLDQWRRQVDCLFGLSLNGVPISSDTKETAFDSSGKFSCPAKMFLQSDRIPFEPIVGWDANGNGNLAQVLQEPTLMGAYEGAGVTTMGRGVKIPANSNDFWGIQTALAGNVAGAFADGSLYLTATDCVSNIIDKGRDYGTSNFLCNPSRIDGLSITNSSQGGGAVFMHGWNHNLEVANTRVFGNHGTLSGGINLGNGETPGAYANDGVTCGGGIPAPAPLCPPLPAGTLPGELIPLQINTHVRLHHNAIYNNAGIGDALFSGTPSGAGAVTISAGGDYYRLDHNWIAGNLSTGDGGGVEHVGQSYYGSIDHNFILFNQSTNPTLPTNGGGLGIIGANNPRLLNGAECGTATDADCPPGLGDGTGKGLVIDSNLIMGNSAESGSGGGLRLQQVNGVELTSIPLNPDRWYDVKVINNIIANNVAGWDGGGVSMEDALKVSVINNTIASNDTTASAGVLFKTLAAINASSTPPGCTPTTDPTLPQNQNCLYPNAAHVPQPAGLVTSKNTVNMVDALNGVTVICPSGYGYTGGLFGIFNGNCRAVSIPVLTNDLIWQNRAFHVEITGAGSNLISQQNLVAMVPVLNQTSTGFCAASGLGSDLSSPLNVFYWDVGVRDDVVPNDGRGGVKLSLQGSLLTPGVTYGTPTGGTPNRYPTASPVVRQYCNGARVAPENGGHGFLSPPGSSETTGLAKLFTFNNIQPAATVDEGHNWINLTYGPLTLSSSANAAFSTAGTSMLAVSPTGPALGAYSIFGTSAAVNGGNNAAAPPLDFFGNPRPKNIGNPADIGAVEFRTPNVAIVVVTPAALSFSGTIQGTTSATQILTLANNGGAAMTGITVNVTSAGNGTFARNGGTCTATLNFGATCTIGVQYTASATVGQTATGQVTIGGSVGVVNSPVTLTGSSAAGTLTASVSPSPLAFGNWASGTTSSALNLTVRNTGNAPLAGLTYTGVTAPFARVTAGAGNCGGTLAVGASCTVMVQFAPTAVTGYTGSLTVAGTGATITPTPVVLTGTGVAARATVSITPNPLTVTLPSTAPGAGAVSGTGLVTLTNTALAGGAQVLVSNVTVAGGTFFDYAWTLDATTCAGITLAPGSSCTTTARFTYVNALGNTPRGTAVRAGTITFTDNGAGSTQTGVLRGIASQAAVAFRNTPCTGANITTLAWGTSATPLTACVVNTGNGDLNIAALGAVVAANTQFSKGTQLPSACVAGATVAAGQSCTVVINRTRPTTGTTSGTGTMTVNDTGAATGTQVLNLSGN